MLRALDLAEALDEGDITPQAVLELCAQAITAREAELGCFEHLDLDRARILACRRPKGPLGGLPVGMKDIIETAAMPTAYGVPFYRDHRPVADAPIVVLTEDAGGIVLGKTVTTELAFLSPPKTRNPHDPRRTPGGSSSGSAAAVAAGMLPLAFGTQTSGSVIRPASFCGVAAMKPSYRLLPITGVKPFAPLLDTLGLIGARVADVAFGLEAITGRSLRVDGQDFGTPTFGITPMPFAGSAEPEAEAALRRAIHALGKAGATLVDVTLDGHFAAAHDAQRTISLFEAAQHLAFEHRRHPEALSATLRAALDEGRAIPVAEFDAARSVANRARKATHALFEPVDVLLTYSAPGPAPLAETTGDPRFNRLVTLLGLPAVNVPGCRTDEGLPVGVQVVAAFGDDQRALAAAAFLERALEASAIG